MAVQWGAWGGAGMALRVPGFLERMARRGLGVLHPAAGLAALSQSLQTVTGPLERMAPVLVGAVSLSVMHHRQRFALLRSALCELAPWPILSCW